jgi:RNA polymerase sigma factor (sigma-70 family)
MNTQENTNYSNSYSSYINDINKAYSRTANSNKTVTELSDKIYISKFNILETLSRLPQAHQYLFELLSTDGDSTMFKKTIAGYGQQDIEFRYNEGASETEITVQEQLTIKDRYCEIYNLYTEMLLERYCYDDLEIQAQFSMLRSEFMKIRLSFSAFTKISDHVVLLNEVLLDELQNEVQFDVKSDVSIQRKIIETSTNMIVNLNLKYVIKIVKSVYPNYGYKQMDLIQEGNVGLKRAAYRFESFKQYQFTTYAVRWIKQAIHNSVRQQSGVIYAPINANYDFWTIERARKKIEAVTLEPPTISELASHLNMTDKRVEEISRLTSIPLPLEDREKELSESDDGLHNTDPATLYQIIDRQKAIKSVLQGLAPRERTIVACRFGIGQSKTYTTKEVSTMVDVGEERVRQIEKNVLAKLKDHPVLTQYC